MRTLSGAALGAPELPTLRAELLPVTLPAEPTELSVAASDSLASKERAQIGSRPSSAAGGRRRRGKIPLQEFSLQRARPIHLIVGKTA